MCSYYFLMKKMLILIYSHSLCTLHYVHTWGTPNIRKKSKFQNGCKTRMFWNFRFFSKHAGFTANLKFQFFCTPIFLRFGHPVRAMCHTIIIKIWDNSYILRQHFLMFYMYMRTAGTFLERSFWGWWNFWKKLFFLVFQMF